MPDESPLIKSLRTAVDAAPDDVPLRLHLAQLLLDAGHVQDAIAQAAGALQREPGNTDAQVLMARAVAPAAPAVPAAPAALSAPAASTTPVAPAPPSAPTRLDAPPVADPATAAGVTAPAATDEATAPDAPPATGGPYDWKRAENELADVVPPRFVQPPASSPASSPATPPAPSVPGPSGPSGPPPEPEFPEAPLTVDGSGTADDSSLWEVQPGDITLADVGGMHEVKDRLEAAFLAPMRNPELRKLYGKSLRGGLLLYGPPGCGKTYIARAVAGELGARFMSVSISDVLDMWIGNSERNLRQLFETARRNAPCVLFLDELDALGAKRSQIRNTGMRNTVNQLLTELDGVDGSANDGVFVLAATNHPWDVDTALRRPGRLDRMLLVLPPDRTAREGIIHHHLKDRPVAGIDLAKLAKRTEGFSGADLRHLCESAAERALLDSVRTGRARMIEMSDLLGALDQLRPSTGPWFASARNVAQFANDGGAYDELLTYLKRKKML
ncbi:ATP-binding protein [Streptomyces albireticuli]|uniref:ATP-binding protein n=1 Tax=Streptomyces albireticuli TaxID=1940 RepID=UPI001E2C5ADC|nr:ATP-binding protein [Streptomyces albireticuli]MCD9141812.1 ATP-binding protein [Streptomyces albireticuli]MCD9163244.1 ATP-binding protein [Streptomyces albireticuli]MCD9189985.1 ATP-binding protein [Streptomyces albireticuli]